eukprot:8795754-Pyramimonas_sp.AAC.1
MLLFTEASWQMLKRVGRCLKKCPNMVSLLRSAHVRAFVCRQIMLSVPYPGRAQAVSWPC